MTGTVDIAVRAPQIRAEVTVDGETNFAEALARLFDDPTINDPAVPGVSTPLALRLLNIFASSGDAYSTGITHFSGIFKGWYDSRGWGDTGFKRCFQDHDLWPGSSMQVCHCMTAADMGYRPHKTYLFVNHYTDMLPGDPWEHVAAGINQSDPGKPMTPGWWSQDELECVNLMIAHEKVADSGTYGEPPTTWGSVRTMWGSLFVSTEEYDAFRQAFIGLGAGPQFDIPQAQGRLSSITIGDGSGNSREDLLLSLFGFKFGAMIAKAQLTSLADGANWVRLNLKDPASKP